MMLTKRFPAVIIAAFVALALLTSACSAEGVESADGVVSVETEAAVDSAPASDAAAVSDAAAPGTTEASEPELLAMAAAPETSDAFCEAVADLVQLDPFADIDLTNGVEGVFTDVLDQWSALAESAPSEIQADMAVIRDDFAQQRSVAEQFDFKMMDGEFVAAMAEMDTTASEAAHSRIGSYLKEDCGISAVIDSRPASLEDMTTVPEDPAGVLVGLFGIDQETADCLVEEFGIEPGQGMADFDMTRLNEEMCGTTMMTVVSGMMG